MGLSHLVRLLLACVVVALALAAARPSGALPPSQLEREVLREVNNHRAAHGLARLKMSKSLHGSARAYAKRLIKHDYFHHANLPGGIGETLAWGSKRNFDPAKIVQLWMESPPHRRLLLLPSARKGGFGIWAGNFRNYVDVRMAVGRVS